MTDIKDLTLDKLREEMARMGLPVYRADQTFAWLYKRGAADFGAFTDFPKPLRASLAGVFSLGRLEPESVFEARDRTRKYLFRLDDGEFVETVLIPARGRRTVCLSTQVGCKFGCAFCASGRIGFIRNLRPAEITGQLLYLRDALDDGPTNVVFMGMGEPLDNMDAVAAAIRILNAPQGIGLAARRMTISTSGVVPGIARVAALGLQVNLSISLHAADDLKRDRLMPINRKYPLSVLVEAIRAYLAGGGRRITFEYILIAGYNDSAADAAKLAALAHSLRAKVNLIPVSPVAGVDFAAPDESVQHRFAERLEAAGAAATLRKSKGRDIQAACGQLAGRRRTRPGLGG